MKTDVLDFLTCPQRADEGMPPFLSGERCLLEVGARVGVWTVTGLLGRGGHGEVYRASGEEGGFVAIKVLHRLDAAARARFSSEVELMLGLGGGTLPQVFSRGVWKEYPYVVMELLEPVEVPTKEREIANYLIAVCGAVAQLHRRGIVHRDLKPTNVMRRKAGGIVLIDVGLAKDVVQTSRPREGMTIVDGAFVGMGTLGYAAPEQMTGGAISTRTDIHALGMLARRAFQLRAEERGIVFSEKAIPGVWRSILARATSSVAEQRFPSVEALADAIRRRHLGRWLIVGLVALLGAFAVIGVWAGWPAEENAERRAWSRLCETVVTNEVQLKRVPIQSMPAHVDRKNLAACFIRVTNRVTLTRVSLAGTTNVFRRPIQLAEGGQYQIVGPGLLDATFESAGTNTIVRLQNCKFNNRTRTPLERGGVFYRIVGRGVDLNFPNLKDPWPNRRPPQYPQYDSAYNHVRYGVPGEKRPDPFERKGDLSSENF